MSVFSFISEERSHEWTLVIVKEEGRDVEDIQSIAADFFGPMTLEQKEKFHKPTFLYWGYS